MALLPDTHFSAQNFDDNKKNAKFQQKIIQSYLLILEEQVTSNTTIQNAMVRTRVIL